MNKYHCRIFIYLLTANVTRDFFFRCSLELLIKKEKKWWKISIYNQFIYENKPSVQNFQFSIVRNSDFDLVLGHIFSTPGICQFSYSLLYLYPILIILIQNVKIIFGVEVLEGLTIDIVQVWWRPSRIKELFWLLPNKFWRLSNDWVQ